MNPSSIQIGITEKCNLHCLHCDIWAAEKIPELNCGEWIDVIASIKSWLGPYRLDISGGEPFIRRDLLEIIEFCHKNEIKPVVTTNATLLTDEIIEKLSGIDSLTLNISLDGNTPYTHDYLRGREGVYQKVMDALYKFKRHNHRCYITIATILMGYNVSEIINIVKKNHEEKLANGINFQALDYNFRANYDEEWFRKNKFWPDKTNVDRIMGVIDELVKLKRSGIVIYNSMEQLAKFKEYFRNPSGCFSGSCESGENNFIINPSGKVLLCWNMELVGDVKKEPPEVIWNSFFAKKRREEIKRCMRTCRILNCNVHA